MDGKTRQYWAEFVWKGVFETISRDAETLFCSAVKRKQFIDKYAQKFVGDSATGWRLISAERTARIKHKHRRKNLRVITKPTVVFIRRTNVSVFNVLSGLERQIPLWCPTNNWPIGQKPTIDNRLDLLPFLTLNIHTPNNFDTTPIILFRLDGYIKVIN